jgi:hypothetical protein
MGQILIASLVVTLAACASSAQAGYRYLLEDFDDDGFIYDVALHGPLIGFSFRF